MQVRLSNGHFFGMRKQIEKSFWIILGCCPLLEANFDFDKACPSTSSFEIVCLMSKHVVQILIRFKCFLLFEINNCVLYCEWTKKLADRVFCKKDRERATISFPDSFFISLYKWKLCQPKIWRREDAALKSCVMIFCDKLLLFWKHLSAEC